MLSATRLRFFYVMVLFFVLSWSLMPSVFASSNRELAVSSISEADHSVTRAYEAVLDVERVGANVSDLLVRLNNAAGLLSEARMEFEAGSFEEAIRLADLSREVGIEVRNEAERLKVEANNAGVNRFRFSLACSVLAVAIVVSTSLFGYRYFKRRYFKRLLKMRPRVGQG